MWSGKFWFPAGPGWQPYVLCVLRHDCVGSGSMQERHVSLALVSFASSASALVILAGGGSSSGVSTGVGSNAIASSAARSGSGVVVATNGPLAAALDDGVVGSAGMSIGIGGSGSSLAFSLSFAQQSEQFCSRLSW